MENKKREYHIIIICLTVTTLIGLFVILFSLNEVEVDIISNMQSFAQLTNGIWFLSIVTYLGDFYLLSAFSVIYLILTYIKFPKWLNISKQIIVFLILVNISTFIFKIVYARPRPNNTNIIFYWQEDSFAYPSGHVSRAAGTFIILLGTKRTIRIILIFLTVFLVSLSRVILGVHYPTDTIGGVFLSLAMVEASKLTAFLLQKSKKLSN